MDWSEFAEEAPALARSVSARFLATKHHVLATLRADGSPRVHGAEVQFHLDDLVVGMMHGSVKARDLQRDGRCALHANPGDSTMTGGDAKLSAIAIEVVDADALAAYVEAVHPPPPFHMFRLDLTEVVLTSLHPDGDRLVVSSWRPGRGVSVVERQ